MARLTKWLIKIVKAAGLGLLFCPAFTVVAQERQTLALEEAFRIAEQQYPISQQKDLLKQTGNLSVRNLNSNYLPQITVNGQSSYQSDVTKVAIPLPGIKIPEQSKDQYRAVAEVSQLLYDGGLVRNQKDIQLLTTSVETHKVEVELHQLKARISQLYFSILYQDELLKQTTLTQNDIQAGINKVKPQVENGVVLRSNLLLLQAQLLQVQQKQVEIRSARKGLIDALAQYLHQPITDGILFTIPSIPVPVDTVITRPEVTLFQSQSLLLSGQERLITSRNLPKASAFFQGGYGRPGLNLLSDQFKSFYISGVRINWSLGGLYNAHRERQLIEISKHSLDLQKETFLLTSRSLLQQQKAEIEKYTALLATDEEIIGLRRQITDAAKAQLENAVITANDFLQQVNAEDAARQSLILHHLQMLQAKTDYLITSGKL